MPVPAKTFPSHAYTHPAHAVFAFRAVIRRAGITKAGTRASGCSPLTGTLTSSAAFAACGNAGGEAAAFAACYVYQFLLFLQGSAEYIRVNRAADLKAAGASYAPILERKTRFGAHKNLYPRRLQC